jgi:hypothetical protein
VIKKAELKDRLAIARKAFDKQIKEKEVVINKEVNCLDSGLLFEWLSDIIVFRLPIRFCSISGQKKIRGIPHNLRCRQ